MCGSECIVQSFKNFFIINYYTKIIESKYRIWLQDIIYKIIIEHIDIFYSPTARIKEEYFS